MALKIDTTKPAFMNCPYFNECDKNQCSLHADYLELWDDVKMKCKFSKRKRFALGQAFSLKMYGLTKREFSCLKPQKLKQGINILLSQDTPQKQGLIEQKHPTTSSKNPNVKRDDNNIHQNITKQPGQIKVQASFLNKNEVKE